MKKIKEYFLNSKYAFIVGVLNLVFMSLLFFATPEKNIQHVIVYLFGLIPTAIYFLIVFFANKYKEKRKVKNTLNILGICLIYPHFLYTFMWLFVFALCMAMNPYTELSSYAQSQEYFPEEIPENYIAASYYCSFPFLQGGAEDILYLKLDEKQINQYINVFKDKNVDRHEDLGHNVYKTYENTPYANVPVGEDFVMYTLDTECDDSGYCNHGIDKHIVINNKTNEIIFYYGNW